MVGLFVLIPILWFLPEYWGSGHFLRGANRAQHPRSNSPAFAKCPFCTELVDHAWPTVLLRIKARRGRCSPGSSSFVLCAAVAPRRRRARLRDAAGPRARPPRPASAVLGLAWFVVIAIMTQAGFSGNNRYLVIGSALIDVCGAVAWGWAAAELVGAGRSRRAARRSGLPAAAGLDRLAVLAVMASCSWPCSRT